MALTFQYVLFIDSLKATWKNIFHVKVHYKKDFLLYLKSSDYAELIGYKVCMVSISQSTFAHSVRMQGKVECHWLVLSGQNTQNIHIHVYVFPNTIAILDVIIKLFPF